MTLADILIPLAGSISNEKALKMREACDLLESRVDINQRGTNHAHDLISLLTDRVKELERDNLDRRLTKLERAVDVLDRQRVETLNLRVNGLESMVLELKDATKNIALHTDETLRAVRGGGCTCTHEKRLHANATDGCLVSGCRCETYTGEGASTREGDAASDPAVSTPSPASSVPAPATGEVPAWIPSVEEMLELIDDGREGDLISLIAIRAPAAPVVDVSRLLIDYRDGTCATNEEDMTRALASQGVKCKEVQP